LLHFKIPREEVEGWLFLDSFRNLPLKIAALEKGEVVFPDAAAVTEALISQKIDALTLDPFVKTHGVPENDNAAIDRVVRKFGDIAEEAGCSIELPHHVRKASNFGRVEITADDGRGAGSLKDGARCVRVMNVMSEAEAPAAQVKIKDRKRYFRVDDGAKANMTAPAETATWYKIVSVPLRNDVSDPNAPGDSIGVVISWKLPGVFAGNPPNALATVQAKIGRGVWAKSAQANDWAGYAIAEVLEIDMADEAAKERVKKMLAAWIESGALKVHMRPGPKTHGRARPEIIVGNWVEGAVRDET
jgi:hypothetical protein